MGFELPESVVIHIWLQSKLPLLPVEVKATFLCWCCVSSLSLRAIPIASAHKVPAYDCSSMSHEGRTTFLLLSLFMFHCYLGFMSLSILHPNRSVSVTFTPMAGPNGSTKSQTLNLNSLPRAKLQWFFSCFFQCPVSLCSSLAHLEFLPDRAGF